MTFDHDTYSKIWRIQGIPSKLVYSWGIDIIDTVKFALYRPDSPMKYGQKCYVVINSYLSVAW